MHDTVKPYKLTFEERPGYLYAHIKADTMTTDMSAAYLGEIADKCSELGLTNVVIYRDVPYILDPASLFFSMQDEIKLLKGLKIALLNAFPANDEALNFAVLVSNNRGANFSLHKTIADAEKWLSS